MVEVGVSFSSAHEGGTPRWQVSEQAGPRVWIAEAVDEKRVADGSVYLGAYTGIRRAFTTEEIEAALERDRAAAEARKAHAAWWASRTEGELIHHDLGAGEFVRGVVVTEDGERRMRAVALVGNWSSFDLPHRDRDGSIVVPLSAETVIQGATMQPELESVYEAPAYGGKAPDPRGLDPIDFAIPEPDAWWTAEYERVRLIDQVVQVLSDELLSTKERLARGRELLIGSGRGSPVPGVDPDEILVEMRKLADGMRESRHPLASRYVELVDLLDRWMAHGGFLPRTWEG